jgi:hypothetical protein
VSSLPELYPDREPPSRQLSRAVTAQSKTELAIYEHNLEARYVAECERIDAEAMSDVIRTSLEEEFGILDWGMGEAAGSPAKAELVARRVAMMSKINSARIARRFGGP